jgi:hypothetical protein
MIISANTAAPTDTIESIQGSIFCKINAPVIEYDKGTSIGGTSGDTMITNQSKNNWNSIIFSVIKKTCYMVCRVYSKNLSNQ